MALRLNLLPQEERFYDLIAESSELAYRCVLLLRQVVLETDPERRIKLSEDIKTAKAKAKSVVTELSEKLCRTFITPLDREDIQALAYGLYKLPKTVEKAQDRILLFQMASFEGDLDRLTANMVAAAEHLRDMLGHIQSMKEMKRVNESCEKIHHVESETDALLSQLLLSLFQNEPDVKQVILRKDLYDLMENIVDRQRDLANIILSIFLKNA